MVVAWLRDGSASAGGLRAGDVILSLGSQRLREGDARTAKATLSRVLGDVEMERRGEVEDEFHDAKDVV